MVPKGWVATQIGDIAKFSSGGTPSKQNANFWGGDKPWISGKDLKTHFIETSIDTLTDEGFQIAKRAPAGASLILVRGMTLLKDFPVGFAIREVAFNQDLKALVPNNNIDGLFLSFLLVSEKHKIKQLVSTAGHGTGRLDTESIKLYPINVPPFTEQKKIAQILSTWDKAIVVTEKLFTNSQQRKKALMQQLLTGKKRLLDENGVRFSGEWNQVKIQVLVEIIYGKSPKEVLALDGCFPIYGTGGICGYASNYLCRGASVLIGRKGTIDRPLYIESSFWAIDTTFFCLPKNKTNLKWFYYLISNVNLKNYSEASGVPSLSRDTIYSIKINVPASQEEQQKIAAVLSAADAEISTLEKKLACLKNEKKALMQQLLTGKRRVSVPVKVEEKEAVSA